MERRQWLTDLASVWYQMRSHAHQLLDVMGGFMKETQRSRTSYINVSMAEAELRHFSDTLHEFTLKNDDLKLVNKRYRYCSSLQEGHCTLSIGTHSLTYSPSRGRRCTPSRGTHSFTHSLSKGHHFSHSRDAYSRLSLTRGGATAH